MSEPKVFADPCLSCGSEANLKEVGPRDSGDFSLMAIKCERCGLRTKGSYGRIIPGTMLVSYDSEYETWNTRDPALSQALVRIEELEAFIGLPEGADLDAWIMTPNKEGGDR